MQIKFYHRLGKSLTPKISSSRLRAPALHPDIVPPTPSKSDGCASTRSRVSSEASSNNPMPNTAPSYSADEMSRQQARFFHEMAAASSLSTTRPRANTTATTLQRPSTSACDAPLPISRSRTPAPDSRPSTGLSRSPHPLNNEASNRAQSPYQQLGVSHRRPATADAVVVLATPLTPLARPPSRARTARPTTPSSRHVLREGDRTLPVTPPRMSSLDSNRTPKARLRPSTAA